MIVIIQKSRLPECDNPGEKLKEIVGRPIGCNLEPVDLEAELMEEGQCDFLQVDKQKKTYIKAQELGFNFILLILELEFQIIQFAKQSKAKKYFKS